MSGQRGGGGGAAWYPVDIGRSGHGGFAGASGGGGGGGRRPWKRGDGPKGHRYEDPRRDARVQKNTGRGRGRGGGGRGGRGRGGRGRGGQERDGRADRLPTWKAEKTYDHRDTGPRQQIEGVKFDSKLNDFGNGSPIRDGRLAVDGYDRDRLMKSNADAFEAADVRNGLFYSTGAKGPGIHSMTDRVMRTRPPGTTWTVAWRAEDREDGSASSVAARDRLLNTMIIGDPFAVDRTMGRTERRVPTETAAQSADPDMQGQTRKDDGDRMDYEQEAPGKGQPGTEPGRYQGA